MTAKEIKAELIRVADSLDGFASFEEQKKLQSRLRDLAQLPVPPSAEDFRMTIRRLTTATAAVQDLYTEREKEAARLIRMSLGSQRTGVALLSALQVLEGTVGLPFVTASGRSCL